MSQNAPKAEVPRNRLAAVQPPGGPAPATSAPPRASLVTAGGPSASSDVSPKDNVRIVAHGSGRWNVWKFRQTTSFLISLIIHVTLILILSLIVISDPIGSVLSLIVTTAPENSQEPGIDLADARLTTSDLEIPRMEPLAGPRTLSIEPEITAPSAAVASSRVQPVLPDGLRASPRDLMIQGRNRNGGGFQGRSKQQRDKLALGRGGSGASQEAVALGLAWLVAHQHSDGGWRFDLSDGPCHGRCRDSGTIGTTTGATGLALLALLGSGQTHLEGEYRDEVQRGLYYLKSRMIRTSHGGDLQEGSMYGHGIATIALCEAYGMTQDDTLRDPAQKAVDFICFAQHSKGGWRYVPRSPGDTTVYGWQMMALKSASLAGLRVPSPVISLAERYLDSVQEDDGAYYGYMTPDKVPVPTAVGLLIRMYLGWDQHDPRLERGVAYLVKRGPSRTNMYFNYYATQVLFHQAGPSWPKWNVTMRDFLVRTQQQRGHERGSWYFTDPHAARGGRLYTTAICVMILEVYYRHMPLYAEHVTETDL